MDRKPITLTLTPTETAVYDSRDRVAVDALRNDIETRARATVAAGGVSSVSVYHPAGFVAVYVEARTPAFGWYR